MPGWEWGKYTSPLSSELPYYLIGQVSSELSPIMFPTIYWPPRSSSLPPKVYLPNLQVSDFWPWNITEGMRLACQNQLWSNHPMALKHKGTISPWISHTRSALAIRWSGELIHLYKSCMWKYSHTIWPRHVSYRNHEGCLDLARISLIFAKYLLCFVRQRDRNTDMFLYLTYWDF